MEAERKELTWRAHPARERIRSSFMAGAVILTASLAIYISFRSIWWSSLSLVFLVASLVVIAVPLFWLGLMSVMVFSVKWTLFPSGGMSTLGLPFSVADHLRHLALPSLVLSLAFAAGWSRYTRETVRETLDEDYVTVARAKGLSPTVVLFRHVFRNSISPVVTVVAMSLPVLFTGSVVVETIFAWPGMGRLFYDGLLKHDYTRTMGVVFVSSVLVALFNLLADCLYGILDPRARSGR